MMKVDKNGQMQVFDVVDLVEMEHKVNSILKVVYDMSIEHFERRSKQEPISKEEEALLKELDKNAKLVKRSYMDLKRINKPSKSKKTGEFTVPEGDKIAEVMEAIKALNTTIGAIQVAIPKDKKKEDGQQHDATGF